MMLVSDMILVWDEEFRPFLTNYAEDADLLKKDFGEAFKKLTELGCPWTTVSEN
jgi:cytochrome c peroxidase